MALEVYEFCKYMYMLRVEWFSGVTPSYLIFIYNSFALNHSMNNNKIKTVFILIEFLPNVGGNTLGIMFFLLSQLCCNHLNLTNNPLRLFTEHTMKHSESCTVYPRL